MYRLGTAWVDGRETVVVGHARGADPLGTEASLLEVIEAWEDWEPRIDVDRLAGALDPAALAWAPPLRPPALLLAGANYQDHNREMLGAVRNEFPYFFLKPPTALAAHGAAVPLPGYASKIDYEGELAVVVGADSEPWGYTLLNDLSVRDWVPGTTILGIDWIMAKGFDGSAPLGPWVTPAAFVDEVQALSLRTWVNGELRQDGTTADMVFTVAEQLAHLRQVLTLQPGAVVATGTPAGVGMGQDPPAWLVAGDTIRIEIEGLGTLETTMAPAGAARKEHDDVGLAS